MFVGTLDFWSIVCLQNIERKHSSSAAYAPELKSSNLPSQLSEIRRIDELKKNKGMQ